jgi:hypothetical protein
MQKKTMDKWFLIDYKKSIKTNIQSLKRYLKIKYKKTYETYKRIHKIKQNEWKTIIYLILKIII